MIWRMKPSTAFSGALPARQAASTRRQTFNGSSKPPGSPFLNDHGLAPVFRVEKMKLRKVMKVRKERDALACGRDPP